MPAGRPPPDEPLWRDPDRRPFAAELKPYESLHDYDRIEKTFVLPLLDVLTVSESTQAVNVNALDEVADSSWYVNRLSRFPLSPEAAALGACGREPVPEDRPWRVVAAKPDGVTPGFVFEAAGERYFAKLDAAGSQSRSSLADVVGALIYHAAGYHVPCNAIAHFELAMLELAPAARREDALGRKAPLTREHLSALTRHALRRADGRFRVVVSHQLPGRPLGAWRYHGVRADDRNDVVRHEDRRELRAARLLAALTDHVDQREGNTLATWRETGPGRGYVMHYLLDFGDCLGSLWGVSVQDAWRRGHDYWINPRTILADWLSLGLVERPWDRAALGPLGLTLGFYDVESFDAEAWRPRYPNPAFSRMTEHDAAWMARIISRLDPPLLEAMLDRGQPPAPLRAELMRVLVGRRRKLLERYLTRLSPLAVPELRQNAEGSWLCVTDLAVRAGVASRSAVSGRWLPGGASAAEPLVTRQTSAAETCVRLPELGAALGDGLVELAQRGAEAPGPLRVRVALAGGRLRVSALERLAR